MKRHFTCSMLVFLSCLTTAFGQDGASPAVQSDASPRELAKLEGLVRERLAKCPYSAGQRNYAMHLSDRAGEVLTNQYGLAPADFNEAISSGRAMVRELMTKNPQHGMCSEKEKVCLLKMLVDRDAAVADLVGPPTQVEPADWPDVATMECDDDDASQESSADLAPSA